MGIDISGDPFRLKKLLNWSSFGEREGKKEESDVSPLFSTKKEFTKQKSRLANVFA